VHIQQLGMRVRDRAALPSLRYACSGGACCPAAAVSLASRVRLTLQRDDETSEEALSLSSSGLRGNINAEARSAPQTITA